jgi:hypothetical protein
LATEDERFKDLQKREHRDSLNIQQSIPVRMGLHFSPQADYENPLSFSGK